MSVKVSNQQAGFSLVELMVVVAVVGVFASIAVPNFHRYQAKARTVEARNNLAAYFVAAKAAYSEWNMYIGNFVAIGFRPEGRLGYRVTVVNAAAMPGGYVGPDEATCVTTGGAPADCDQSGTDGVPWGMSWTEAIAPSAIVPTAPDASCAPATASATFAACASGQHNGSPVVDTWRIDERKILVNTMAGI